MKASGNSYENNVLKELQSISRVLKCNQNNSGSGGGNTPTPIIPYNKETEVVIENTNHVIGANTVHAYSVFVEQGTGTISINSNPDVNIGLGYQKNIEFTTTNDYSVVITANINSKIRIIKIY